MWNATIKGLLSHKLRLALTALAIVLGVSFVSGTYVLTDTMGAAFTGLFQDVNKGVDVVVHTKETFTGQQGDVRDPMPESLLATIQRVDGVKVLLQGPARVFTISGIVGFGEADNLGGATLAVFDLKTAQQVLNRPGQFDEIDVVAQPGTSDTQLRERIAAAVPAKYEAVTGSDQAKRSADEINKSLSFFTTALLAFAGVALFVGAFLIFNTFSIIVAQRTREMALLRCLGASRRQVLGSVLLEAGIVGVAASLVGLGLGLVLAVGLRAMR